MALNKQKKNCVLGRLSLFAITLIWGSSFVILKETLDVIPTLYVLAFRFLGSAVVLLPFALKSLKKLDMQYIKGGVLMGVFLFIAYIFQTFGLEQTTPGKNAFLTATYCIIVPFLYWLVAKRKPSAYNIAAALICVVGVGLVSLDGNLSVNAGDMLTLCCGLFFALHILATNHYIEGRDAILLTMVQFATAGVLSTVCAFATTPVPTHITTPALWSMLYLMVMCTAVSNFLQTYGQKYTPPSSAALIMTLESVFGALISITLGYEKLSISIAAGFALIFVAIVVSETKLEFLKRKTLN